RRRERMARLIWVERRPVDRSYRARPAAATTDGGAPAVRSLRRGDRAGGTALPSRPRGDATPRERAACPPSPPCEARPVRKSGWATREVPMWRISSLTLLLAALLPGAPHAQVTPGADAPSDSVPLYDDLGTHHYAITTD